MEQVEKELIDVWKHLKSKMRITMDDIDNLDYIFGNVLTKINRQRIDLEKSRNYRTEIAKKYKEQRDEYKKDRDMWKKLYEELNHGK